MTGTRIGQIGIPAAIVGIVVMMVVPLPSVLLDLLLAVNLTGSVLIRQPSIVTLLTLPSRCTPSRVAESKKQLGPMYE